MSFLEGAGDEGSVLADVLAFIDDEFDSSSSGTDGRSQEDESGADQLSIEPQPPPRELEEPPASSKRSAPKKRPTSAARNHARVQRYHREKAELAALRTQVAELEELLRYLEQADQANASAVLAEAQGDAAGEEDAVWRAEAALQFQYRQRALLENHELKKRMEKALELSGRTSGVVAEWASVYEGIGGFVRPSQKLIEPVPPWTNITCDGARVALYISVLLLLGSGAPMRGRLDLSVGQVYYSGGQQRQACWQQPTICGGDSGTLVVSVS